MRIYDVRFESRVITALGRKVKCMSRVVKSCAMY